LEIFILSSLALVSLITGFPFSGDLMEVFAGLAPG
jgi:hypothetical protein